MLENALSVICGIGAAGKCAFGDLYHMEAMGVNAQAVPFINKHRFGRWLIINGISACGHINKQNETVQSGNTAPFTW